MQWWWNKALAMPVLLTLLMNLRMVLTLWLVKRCYISEGQAQRIAIARSFLRERPILILEATSALDPETEVNVLKAVRALPTKPHANKTTGLLPLIFVIELWNWEGTY